MNNLKHFSFLVFHLDINLHTHLLCFKTKNSGKSKKQNFLFHFVKPLKSRTKNLNMEFFVIFSREKTQMSPVDTVFTVQFSLELLMDASAFFQTFRPPNSQRKTNVFFYCFKIFANLLLFEFEILKKKQQMTIRIQFSWAIF